MLIRRSILTNLVETINELKYKNFNIQTQYKMLKIGRAAQEEILLQQELIFNNCKEYYEQDENGNYIINDQGGYKIKKEYIQKCTQMVYQISNEKVQMPDIYFTLDELEDIVTMAQLDCFLDFIKK